MLDFNRNSTLNTGVIIVILAFNCGGATLLGAISL